MKKHLKENWFAITCVNTVIILGIFIIIHVINNPELFTF